MGYLDMQWFGYLDPWDTLTCNVLEGQNFQDALKNEARVGVGNLLSKASDHLQKGHGKKRRGRPKAIKEDKKSKKLLLTSRVGPLPKRSRLRVDTLGYY